MKDSTKTTFLLMTNTHCIKILLQIGRYNILLTYVKVVIASSVPALRITMFLCFILHCPEFRFVQIRNNHVFFGSELFFRIVLMMDFYIKATQLQVLSFSKQRDASLQRAGLNFPTTIYKHISIGSSKSMKFVYQKESQPIH